MYKGYCGLKATHKVSNLKLDPQGRRCSALPPTNRYTNKDISIEINNGSKRKLSEASLFGFEKEGQ